MMWVHFLLLTSCLVFSGNSWSNLGTKKIMCKGTKVGRVRVTGLVECGEDGIASCWKTVTDCYDCSCLGFKTTTFSEYDAKGNIIRNLGGPDCSGACIGSKGASANSYRKDVKRNKICKKCIY